MSNLPASLLATSKEYICAVDIAKKRDYTTIQIYRDSPDVKHFPAESGRDPLVVNYLDLIFQAKMQAVRYTEQVKRIRELLDSINMIQNTQLLVDGTGVGEPVVDMMREQGLMPLPIVFTGGTEARPVYADFGKVFGSSSNAFGGFSGATVLKEMHVPKEDLVHAGMIIMQQGRMRMAANLQHADDFKLQLSRFKGSVNEKTGRKSYNNETDDIHDDLVVTYLMASWWITYRRVTEKERVVRTQDSTDYNPYDYVSGGMR
ncbi:MAG: hypothetical protein EOM32_10150 [Spirochaetia bacterium]|nr:hypothetical protein [Spirochaetia bacterium]